MEKDSNLGGIERFPVVWNTIRAVRRMEVFNSLHIRQQEDLKAYAAAYADALRRSFRPHPQEKRIAAAEIAGKRYEDLTQLKIKPAIIKSVEVIALQEVLWSELGQTK